MAYGHRGLELLRDCSVDSGHPHYAGGPEIAPVIPKNWPGFSATRIFRGVVYEIAIEAAGEMGIQSCLRWTAMQLKGTLLPRQPMGEAKFWSREF